ncbi:MAG TPA: large conductance mechanosensitive channel protein MscL [Actinomycetota bacterium]|nr:large conductance mechanosensitive channel protein MscL [Actinomycetota bacterium]
MLKGFRDFVLRGNVVDLAVAVVIGAAFGAVIVSFVTNILTPIIAIPGSADFADLTWKVSGSSILYGQFINDLISFLLIALAVYFLVVKPVTRLMERRKTEPDVGSATKECRECLSKIPAGARRCAFCTSEQVAS